MKTCKHCNSQVRSIPMKDRPSKRMAHIRNWYAENPEWSFTHVYPTKKLDVCYYHDKFRKK